MVNMKFSLFITTVLFVSLCQPGRSQSIITTLAGTGVHGYSGDGGPATNAYLNTPEGIAIDRHGNLYIADAFNHCVRKVSTTGIISSVTNDGGVPGYWGDG